jgi:hypothetical protein
MFDSVLITALAPAARIFPAIMTFPAIITIPATAAEPVHLYSAGNLLQDLTLASHLRWIAA